MRHLVVAVLLSLATFACGGRAPAPAAAPTAGATPNQVAVALTPDTLRDALSRQFAAQVADGRLAVDFGSESLGVEVVGELAIMGITTVDQLLAIIPPDFATKGWDAMRDTGDATTNLSGLSRDLMIIHDARRYVETAWQNHWSADGPQDFPAPAAYGVDFQILEQAGVFQGDVIGGDPCDFESDPGDGAD
ncbi:MAG: hypothetical protein KBG48_04860 [Kofleriaceae bacterium]|jgi:hypothetical protein|nr:hypothetical protein [Kofleriaceae bacterium]MBP9166691.1 hypothetical protein [Kofleriaceae bacterium]MBP9861476.1 hypothetical protein [Kofleriaceae bacterium]